MKDKTSELLNVTMPNDHNSYGSYISKVDNKVYYIGGYGFNVDTQTYTYLNKVSIFDLSTKEWSTGTPMPVGAGNGNYNGTQAPCINGKIYVVAGNVLEDGSSTVSDKVLIYDITEDIWTYGQSMPIKAEKHSVCQVDDCFHVFGGVNGTTRYTTNYRYNPATDTWTKMSNIYYSNMGYTMCMAGGTAVYDGEYVYLTLGDNCYAGTSSTSRPDSTTSTNRHDYYGVLRYNPSNDSYGAYTTGVSIYIGSYAVLIDNNIYYIGGMSSYSPSSDAHYLTSIARLSISESKMYSDGILPHRSAGHCCANIGGRIIVFGGKMYSSTSYISDMSIYYTGREPYSIELYWRNPKQFASLDIPSVTNVTAIARI